MQPGSSGPSRKLHFIGPRLSAPALRQAAQYIRMSTEHQKYSIDNQKQVIAEYALCHDIKVVRTYIDAGRSGLNLKGRDALQQLIADIQNGHADFNFVLVYDVSRWGRFQDIDESAYYEFMCKVAGVSVVYCAELFENNGSIITTLLKGLKRAMAGEYSRELSRKLSEAHSRFAGLGFHQGGRPNYGLRRMLVAENGRPKMLLRDGQEKNLHNDRIVLVRGPKNEVETVQKIFRMFVDDHMPHKRIARILNDEGIPNARGNRWSGTNIRGVLSNEKYVGTFVYSRTSARLQSKRVYFPKDKWIRVEGAVEPIIDQKTFDAAQLLLKDTWALSDNDLLDYLSATLCVKGYLSCGAIKEMKYSPSYTTYRARFGSLPNAFALIGYKPTHHYRYHKVAALLRRLERQTTDKLISSILEGGGTIAVNANKHYLFINHSLTVAVSVVPYSTSAALGPLGWKLYSCNISKCDIVLVARMNRRNLKILDYHVLPRAILNRQTVWITDENISEFERYKLKSLADSYESLRHNFRKTPEGLFANLGL